MGTVTGVVGARGGVGATTAACVLAREIARRHVGDGSAGRRQTAAQPGTGAVALVDLDPAGAGMDVDLGVEDAPGLRWADLVGARGEVPGGELTALLPRWSGVPVLSGDRWRPGPAPHDVVGDVLDALTACHDRLVVDLSRVEVLGRGPALLRCTTVLVVATCDLRSVAGVVALRGSLRSVPDVRLVVRGPVPGPGGLGALEVAHVVDLPVAGVLPRDRGLAAAVERGTGPAMSGRSRYVRSLRRVAEELR